MSSNPKSGLRTDLARMQVALDKAPDRAVVIDKYGDAWQKSGYLGYWYRAFDGNGVTSFNLALYGDGAQIIHTPLAGASDKKAPTE